jgi:GxxExxY protein
MTEKKAVMTRNAIAKEIMDAAFRIHTTLGPGLLESVTTLYSLMNLPSVDSKRSASRRIGCLRDDSDRYRIQGRPDFKDRVIVEIKSVEALAPVHSF